MKKRRMWSEEEIRHFLRYEILPLSVLVIILTVSLISIMLIHGSQLSALKTQSLNTSAILEEAGWEKVCVEWENLTLYNVGYSYDCGDDVHCEGGIWSIWEHVEESIKRHSHEPNFKFWLIEITTDKGECIRYTWLPPSGQYTCLYVLENELACI